MNRYRPPSMPRALGLLAAGSFTAVILAGVHAEAEPHPAAALEARFTGEVTAHGPVYRLPYLVAVGRRVVETARAEGTSPPAFVAPQTQLAVGPHD